MATATIETYGCSMNKADSEAIAGLLAENGFEICDDGAVLIINTCTVKKPTETKILRRLRGLDGSGKKVIVTGCLPVASPDIAERFKSFSFLGTNVGDIQQAADAALKGGRIVKIAAGGRAPGAGIIRDNKAIAIIPISGGCLGDCSYCVVKNIRGRLRSHPEDGIVGDVRRAAEDGVKEIWLTSQDTGAYGMDMGKNLPHLLEKVSSIEGEFMVRVGMMNPNHVLCFLDELIASFKNEKVYKFLHVPVQSGDDGVLKDMRRRYKAEDFLGIISEFRKRIPEITISTDIIAGFPTEDEPAFQRSLDLIADIEPDIVNISRFWPRPNTEAEKMKLLPGRVTNERSRRLAKLFSAIALEKNRKWIGWTGKAVVSEAGKKSGYCARNFAYKPIVIHPDAELLGRTVTVRITGATRNDLRGEVIASC